MGVFSQENTPGGRTETHKSSFFKFKQVSGRNGDYEWLKMTNAFLWCDLVWKIQKCHAATVALTNQYTLNSSYLKAVRLNNQALNAEWEWLHHTLISMSASLCLNKWLPLGI